LLNLLYDVVLDDEFSKKVYDVYLDRIDGSRRFFTQDDYTIFAAHEKQIDNQLDQADLTFFNVVEERFELAVQRSQDIYREILKTPFNFDQKESVELDGEKKSYPTDADALRESWRKTLKWETMTRLNDKIDQQQALLKKAMNRMKNYSA